MFGVHALLISCFLVCVLVGLGDLIVVGIECGF